MNFLGGGTVCMCNQGYLEPDCAPDTADGCETLVCHNEGVCVSAMAGMFPASCSCQSAWTGDTCAEGIANDLP